MRAGLRSAVPSFLIAVLLAGCGVADRVGNRFDGSWAGDLFGNQERVRVAVEGSDELNPDVAGEPLSVVLRIYQLSERPPFVMTSPRQLWQNTEEVLGSSLVSQRELIVLPGEQRVDVAMLDPQTQYVGVAAFFRNVVNDEWQVLFDAETLRRDGLLSASEGVRLRLVEDRIEVERGSNLLAGDSGS